MTSGLPFLTESDPLISGEGALDPLGLSLIGEQLSDQILPGLRARMSRPRFLTAMAASAAVCDGLEDRFARDNLTPACLVFEWLVVEAFVRAGEREVTIGTPGTLKAKAIVASGETMSARTYLRSPMIFGFHGIYKPLARHVGIVDDDFRLADGGYELLKVWQTEQGLEGFLEGASGDGPGCALRRLLRDAVEDGLRLGHSSRKPGWQGWSLLARHLSPGAVGDREAEFLLKLFLDPTAMPRGEMFRLLLDAPGGDGPEDSVTSQLLLPRASDELRPRLAAVRAYEGACAILEEGFDWIRHLSTKAQARPVTAAEFTAAPRAAFLAAALPGALAFAESALGMSPLRVQQAFAQLAGRYDGVRDEESLFTAILEHHSSVQQAKKPDGKRDWFERSPDGATVVRIPYRMPEPPADVRGWNRPYRIGTVQSFLADMPVGAYAAA